MKIDAKTPPRCFTVKGAGLEDVLCDCAHIRLEPNEQVTFITPNGAEYDVARKSWGYYATPSTNGRLKSFNFRTALVRASTGRFFVMLVETDKIESFLAYLTADKQALVCWLDDEKDLARLSAAFQE
ncbi:hypothetical protein [Undibacter mobilis]|uniref:Uncharacterized protein n=1 Tax=Undibacter mobilis TaxID=2292256 RepID=A0A371B6E9_9BRAD|nr:hypothetical protein [Undibacter mobilis]RDV03166.1 hypothetical protein DXH78_00305 [Undibacter mobilis]